MNSGGEFSGRKTWCMYPGNWVKTEYDDPEKHIVKKWTRKSPWEINKDNNCKWYDKRHIWNMHKRYHGIYLLFSAMIIITNICAIIMIIIGR